MCATDPTPLSTRVSDIDRRSGRAGRHVHVMRGPIMARKRRRSAFSGGMADSASGSVAMRWHLGGVGDLGVRLRLGGAGNMLLSIRGSPVFPLPSRVALSLCRIPSV